MTRASTGSAPLQLAGVIDPEPPREPVAVAGDEAVRALGRAGEAIEDETERTPARKRAGERARPRPRRAHGPIGPHQVPRVQPLLRRQIREELLSLRALDGHGAHAVA